MKNIKTYEGFFSNKKIKLNEQEIDSFLDDLKDISIGSFKENIKNYIIYSFYITDYNNKKNEIDLFLKEIKSACKSIGINVKITTLDFISVTTPHENIKVDFLLLIFSTGSFIGLKNNLINNIHKGCDHLGLYFDEEEDSAGF